MKKLVSLALAALMVIAIVAGCFSASAAEKKDPTFTADKSMILGRTEKFYANNLTGHTKTYNKDYAGDAITLGLNNTPINISGLAGQPDSKYVTILGNYNVDSSAALKSGIFTFPVTDGKCECAFDAVEIYGCNGEMWDERKDYKTPLETATGRTFTSLASFANIVDQLVFTPDGTLCFFEFNLPTAITGYDYLFLAFPESAKAKIPLNTENNQNITHYTEFALFAEAITLPDYLNESNGDKTDILNGLEATYNCPGEKNGEKTALLTDGIIAVSKAPAGTVEEKYFNRAYGSSDDTANISFAGVDTKALYSFTFSGLGGAKVSSFQVVYGAQNGEPYAGRSYNKDHADKQIMILVSKDNGTTWTQAYISTLDESTNVIKSDAVLGAGNTIDVVDNETYNYYTVNITLAAAIEGVTDIVLASPMGRTQVNGWAARIMEFNAFGEKGAAPATTEAQTTAAPADTTAAPADTTAAPADTTSAPASTTEKTEEKKGCGSVAAIGVAMIVTVLGAAYVSKKH